MQACIFSNQAPQLVPDQRAAKVQCSPSGVTVQVIVTAGPLGVRTCKQVDGL